MPKGLDRPFFILYNSGMDKNMKCETCGDYISPSCDYRQGRCPHRQPILTNYHFRYVNLFKIIKGWFKNGNST
jgi:hypothetical protein